MNNEDDMHIIKEPLLTDDGFVNPVCMAELESVIKNMPNIHGRTSNDPEWNKTHCVSRKDITGALAKWAIRQSPYTWPDNLEGVIKYLDACLKRDIAWSPLGVPNDGIATLSLRDVAKLLYDILYEQGFAPFDDWNKCKKGDTPELKFTSSFEGAGDPDRDFIDLDALITNVCIELRTHFREHARFDKEFEEKYGRQIGK